ALKPDALPDGALVREEPFLDGLAHDHDRRRVRVITIVEQPARDQWNLERPEVAIRRQLPADFRRPLAGRDGLLRSLEWRRPVVAGQRRDGSHAHVLNTGNGFYLSQRLRVEPFSRTALAVAVGGKLNAHRHHVRGAEP